MNTMGNGSDFPEEKRSVQTSMHSLGRRSFLKGIVASAVTVAGAGALSACSSTGGSAQAAGDYTFADTVKWDGEYDVVVVGFGGAGAAAARAAAVEGGAGVLLVDKAPLNNEGGNTRYCGQVIINGNGDVQKTKAYFKALAGTFSIDDEILSVYAEGVANMSDILETSYGLDRKDFRNERDNPEAELVQVLKGAKITPMSPEYPEFPGADTMTANLSHDGISDGYVWEILRKGVTDLPDQIDVWLESPAKKLIQDPQTKTIVGVQIERKGTLLNIRALNGIIMTCGGFENNPKMKEDYLGAVKLVPQGTFYNTGDGIKMALEIGADLWHMTAWEGGMGAFGGVGQTYTEGDEPGEKITLIPFQFLPCTAILIGSGGYRYLNEMETGRHGHYFDKKTNEWQSMINPTPCFVVFDKEDADYIKVQEISDQSAVVSADSIEALADAMGVPAENLAETIAAYGNSATTGIDVEFGRPEESMRAFGDGPYYAVKLQTTFLNTQGGPRRNAKAEVLDTEGAPIPHLYSAGEFGGFTCNMYQGGGNMAENIVFGQIAGRNAAAQKDDLLPSNGQRVESDLVYTLGKETDI